jgi:hypothetical protein
LTRLAHLLDEPVLKDVLARLVALGRSWGRTLDTSHLLFELRECLGKLVACR